MNPIATLVVWFLSGLGQDPAMLRPTPSRSQDDVADVKSEDLRAEKDDKKRLLLIGPQGGAKPPAGGFKLAVIMPGGDGTAEFHPFVKRIWKNALSREYLVAQPVAVQWDKDQEIVWPTKMNPVKGMKFTTEEFVEAVIRDVANRYRVNPRHVFTLSWSSSGPAAYAISLTDKKLVTGSFVSMSVFKPDLLPPMKNAKGHAYYIHHSPDDKTCPFRMARDARDKLKAAGAAVEFSEYDGGHGWKGDMWDQIRRGFEWLEKTVGRR